jgi:hypothetical protein
MSEGVDCSESMTYPEVAVLGSRSEGTADNQLMLMATKPMKPWHNANRLVKADMINETAIRIVLGIDKHRIKMTPRNPWAQPLGPLFTRVDLSGGWTSMDALKSRVNCLPSEDGNCPSSLNLMVDKHNHPAAQDVLEGAQGTMALRHQDLRSIYGDWLPDMFTIVKLGSATVFKGIKYP